MPFNELGVIPVSFIKVPQILQRSFDVVHAKNIIKNFRCNSLGVLTVCKLSDGTYLVVDGQHRLYVMKYKNIKSANCIILPEMTEAEMAILFRDIAESKKISALDKFKSEVRSDEPDVVAIRNIFDKYNIPIGTNGDGHKRGFYLRPISVPKMILKKFGESRLDQTIRVIYGAWPEQPHAMYAAMLYGVALFLEYFGKQSQFNEEKAIKQLSKQSAGSIVKEGKERRKNRGAIPAIEIATPILRNLYNYRTLSGKQLRTSPELEELAFKSK
jgi:hypothetical protein